MRMEIKCPYYLCPEYGKYRRCTGNDYWRCNRKEPMVGVIGDLEEISEGNENKKEKGK